MASVIAGAHLHSQDHQDNIRKVKISPHHSVERLRFTNLPGKGPCSRCLSRTLQGTHCSHRGSGRLQSKWRSLHGSHCQSHTPHRMCRCCRSVDSNQRGSTQCNRRRSHCCRHTKRRTFLTQSSTCSHQSRKTGTTPSCSPRSSRTCGRIQPWGCGRCGTCPRRGRLGQRRTPTLPQRL